MAVLPDNDRRDVWAELMRRLSDERRSITINKDQLRAAVDAADAWTDANAASFNSALPAAARNGLTTAQKALLLVYVVTRRHLRGV